MWFLPDHLRIDPLPERAWRAWYRIPREAIRSIEQRGGAVVVSGVDANHGPVVLRLKAPDYETTQELSRRVTEWAPGSVGDG